MLLSRNGEVNIGVFSTIDCLCGSLIKKSKNFIKFQCAHLLKQVNLKFLKESHTKLSLNKNDSYRLAVSILM